ncbi:hypothetical protein [Rhizobium mesoamericanum]|uniref:hypothetical protein n=1 Tax=Rhizobium mesoamericanum TaxID=1079800 RepID=UPI000401683F|nr:hypothetical protein [Rhizobium mesoamericanum]
MQLAVVDNAEIITPSAGVDVYFRRSPLRQEREHKRLPAGLSLMEIIERCEIEPARLYVTINGHSVEYVNWPRVRVKPGVSINIVKVPGKGALRSILGAIVAIAAAIFAPILAAPLLGSLAGTAVGTAVTGLIAAGLPVTESLSVGRLFPRANTKES